MFYNTPENLIKIGIELHTKSDVISVNYNKKEIKFTIIGSNKVQSTKYDYLLITSGSRQYIPPFIPNINYLDTLNYPDKQLREMKTLDGQNRILLTKNYQDGQLLSQIPNESIVGFIGGGHINIELAWALVTKQCKNVILERGDQILQKYYEKELTKEIEKEFLEYECKIIKNSRVLKIDILADSLDLYVETIYDNKVRTVKFNVQYLIISSGFIPNTEIFITKQLNNLKNIILTNDKQETSIKDVFSAGDCCTQYSNLLQAQKYSPLATHAVKQALVASFEIVKRITGKTIIDNFAIQSSNNTTAIQIFNWSLSSTGLTFYQAKELYPEAQIKILREKIFNNKAKINFETVLQNQELYRNFDLYGELCSYADQIIEESISDLNVETTNENYATEVLIYDQKTLQILGFQIMSKADVIELTNSISMLIQRNGTIIDLLDLENCNIVGYGNNQSILSKIIEEIIQEKDFLEL